MHKHHFPIIIVVVGEIQLPQTLGMFVRLRRNIFDEIKKYFLEVLNRNNFKTRFSYIGNTDILARRTPVKSLKLADIFTKLDQLQADLSPRNMFHWCRGRPE